MEKAEKIYQHRVVPVEQSFECRDCGAVMRSLMALVTQPCVNDGDVGKAVNAKPAKPEPGPARFEPVSDQEYKLMMEEYEFLKLQEDMFMEMERLQELQDEQQALMLSEMQSVANQTIPASSCSPPST